MDVDDSVDIAVGDGLKDYYIAKIEQLQVGSSGYLLVVIIRAPPDGAIFNNVFQLAVSEKTQNLRRLQAQRNELNAKGTLVEQP